jgi:hypothetical protein
MRSSTTQSALAGQHSDPLTTGSVSLTQLVYSIVLQEGVQPCEAGHTCQQPVLCLAANSKTALKSATWSRSCRSNIVCLLWAKL